MAKKSLTASISDYVNAEAKRLGAKGYSEWLSKSSANAQRKYSDAISKAATEYAIKLRDFGGASENISKNGLAKSGYADYLNDSAKSGYLNAVNDAKKSLAENDAESILGYESYLKKLSDKRESLINSVYEELTGNKVTDVDYAYEKALSVGLTEKEAKELAKSATSKTRTTLFRTAVSSIISKTLTKEQAIEYAESLGLPDADVKELGNIANIINQMPASYSKYSGAYINYLKELKNTQK